MTPTIPTIQNLLSGVKRIADHQAEIKRLKGEQFNLFSILGVESAENKTHSAFLGELLNPRGSHGMGNRFLELFLVEIGAVGHLDLKTSISVVLEYHIDWTDYEKETGGRIDIYLRDGNGRTVSIENKIYAGDQHRQIARYVNHNKDRNRVYYLTLDGSEPSAGSRGDFNKKDEHYHCISYRHTIIDWLTQCMKEAADFPILRESIKQYVILIQKLTGQLTDDKMIAEMDDLIEGNYEAAKLVAANFERVRWKVATSYLRLMVKQIEQQLTPADGWKVEIFNPDQLYVGLSIRHDRWGDYANSYDLEVRLWSDRTIAENPYFGVTAHSQVWDRTDMRERLSHVPMLKGGLKESNGWAHYEYVSNVFGPNGFDGLFGTTEAEKAAMATPLAERLIAFAAACKVPLGGIVRK